MDVVRSYAYAMAEQDINCGQIDFPPISGFFTEYDPQCDGETFHNSVEDAEYVRIKKGERVFKVTDGHHRSLAACIAGIWCIEVEEDKTLVPEYHTKENGYA